MQEDHPVIMYKEDFVSEDYGENKKIQNVIEISHALTFSYVCICLICTILSHRSNKKRNKS